MDWLTATKSFCLIVEKGSFTKAANTTEVSTSAISKRIDWLENQLGVSLLIRTTRQVNLTEAGNNFLPRAISLLKQFDSLIIETKQGEINPSGTLKIAATSAVGSSVLMPHIDLFLKLYPTVKIQLDVQPVGFSPSLEHDLVICRKADDFNSAVHKGVHLISYEMNLYASPYYIKNNKKIESISDISKHKIISSNYLRRVGCIEVEGGEDVLLGNYNFISDNIEAMLYAAVNHMGVIFAAPIFIKKELKQGVLVKILEKHKSTKRQLWAFYPKTEFMPLKSRLFLDFLKEKL